MAPLQKYKPDKILDFLQIDIFFLMGASCCYVVKKNLKQIIIQVLIKFDLTCMKIIMF